MHNIKLIRKEPNFFLKKLSHRNTKVSLENILNLDKKNRELIQNKEKLEQEKKIISKKKDKSQFSRSKEISKEIEKIEKSLKLLKDEIDLTIATLPNLALDDVPIGKDEKSNKEIKKVGSIANLNFTPKTHYELGNKLNLMDFETATKVSGARFGKVLNNDSISFLIFICSLFNLSISKDASFDLLN